VPAQWHDPMLHLEPGQKKLLVRGSISRPKIP